MTSGKIDDWRAEPGRFSLRMIKSRRKNVSTNLRRTKSVEEQDKLNNQDKLDVIEEAPVETSDFRDDGYVEDDSIPEEIPIDETQCCVLCVGSTGTGKSFTISTMTGLPVASNAGADSVTKRCALYRPMTKLKGQAPHLLTWIDTVGWDDSDCDDEETFREILRFISSNYLTSIKAIVWHVLPNVRRDALLTRQARLIDQFTDGSEIWDNVIIVCKQAMNPDDDSRGPLRVAMEYNHNAKVQVVGYRAMDDPTLSDKQRKAFEDEDVRAAFNVLTREEIRKLLSEKIANIEKPFQVVFHDSYCTDCAEIGDVRLMSSYCHMAPQMSHSGRVRTTHPKPCEYFHPEPITVYVHEGVLRKSQFYSAVDFFMRKDRGHGKRYSCCNQRAGRPGCIRRWACCRQLCDPTTASEGCKRRYACCKADYSTNPMGCEQRYSCCERLIESEGCQKMCKKCDRPWGSEPRGCYKKSHNVRRLSSYGKDGDEDLALKVGNEKEKSEFSNDEKDKRNSKFIYDFELPPVIIYHVF